MRLAFLAILVAALAACASIPDPGGRDHQVVFELTSDEPKSWNALLNNVENVRAALPGTRVEVVAHGPGLRLLTKAHNAEVAARMAALAAQEIVFAACLNTMKRMQVAPEQLSPFAVPVDSGVAEVVRKQADGWAYVRSG